MNIPKISQNNYYNNVYTKKNAVNFGATSLKSESKIFKPIKDCFARVAKGYEKRIVDKFANGFGRLFQTDSAKWVIDRSKKNKNLFNHLMTSASVVLSSFYILRTLTNKDLDDKKKKTLAINQALVFSVSTVACYTIEGWIKSKINTFANHFEAVNVKHFINDEEKLRKLKKGIDPASKIMVYDMIFRFMAPVFLTPLANYLGNKFNDKKDVKIATSKQNLNKTA